MNGKGGKGIGWKEGVGWDVLEWEAGSIAGKEMLTLCDKLFSFFFLEKCVS